MQYELFYLVGENNETNLDQIKKDIAGIVTKEGGVYVGTEVSEKRKMAYEIKHQYRGTYVAQRFEIAGKDDDNYDPETISRINRQMNLYGNILRFIIVKADELPELKTKEEKTLEAKKQQVKRVESTLAKAPADKKVVEEKAKPAYAKASVDKKIEKAKTAPKKDDSIDKQLEEILNI